MSRAFSSVSMAASAAFAVAVLVGCAPEPPTPSEPSSNPSASSSASPTVSPSVPPSPTALPTVPVSPAPTATEAPEPQGTPLGVSCLDLVSLDTMYRFDPNFGLDDAYSPPSGSFGAAAVADAGLACGWVQQTSGEMIEIAAARPSASALERMRTQAGSADGERVFSTANGRGVVQAFSGPHWVSATSSYFTTVDDAALLVDSALAVLR